MNNQPQQDNSWFGETPNPIQTEPPAKISKRLVIIIASIVVLTLGLITTYYLSANKRVGCLTPSDYATLTGSTPSDDTLSPITNFYTDTVLFSSGKATYDNLSNGGANGEALLKKIATFYTKLDRTSIKITISSSYAEKNSATLAQQRSTATSSTLSALGVSTQDITVSSPAYNQPEDAVSDDPVSTQVSITSATSCVEEQ